MQIRSQNKKRLFNLDRYDFLDVYPNRFKLVKQQDGSEAKEVIGYAVLGVLLAGECPEIEFGEYKTEEKALKVLDEIQKLYEKYKIVCGDVPNILIPPKVYEMPIDEEG